MTGIVLCRGTFDLLHVGHLHHLRQASTMGTFLVVSVTPDIQAEKEKRRPIVSEDERMEMLLALPFVGVVECCDYLVSLKRWQPAVYCKGDDHQSKLLPEELEYCKAHNIEIRFTDPHPRTTSSLLERIECTSS